MRSQTHDLFAIYLELLTSELFWEFDSTERFSPDEIDFLINPRRLRGSDFLMRRQPSR
jgi:hypothetical protein